jgi:hypothetical protein
VVSNGGVSGLSSGRPRLRFAITTKSSYPTVQTLTVRLPRGFAFIRNTARLATAVSIVSAKPILSVHKGALTVHSLPYRSKLTVTVRPQALIETKSLRSLIRRLVAHRQHTVLDIKLQTVTTVGTKSTSILKLRTG